MESFWMGAWSDAPQARAQGIELKWLLLLSSYFFFFFWPHKPCVLLARALSSPLLHG